MANVMKWSVWTSACCLALLIGGCAKRQTGTRLVYVASPPAATMAAPQGSGTLVVEEPAPPPEPDKTPPPQTPADVEHPPPETPQPKANKPRPSPPSPEPPADVEPPPLEPANNPGQGRQQQLEKTQRDMGAHIAQLEGRHPSGAEGQTLTEAKAFLDQSKSALKEGDLQRAEKLAEKARLLITALDKGQGQ
jgi:type IV secretory pathway VirB10-like protein